MDPDSGPVVVIGTYERFLMGFQVPAAQASFQRTFTFPAHKGVVHAVATQTPFLVSGGGDEQLHAYHCKSTSDLGLLLSPGRGGVYALALFAAYASRSNATHLLSGAADGAVTLWQAGHEFAPLKTMIGHSKAVTGLAVHVESGKVGLSASRDGTLRMWNLIKGKAQFKTRLGTVAEEVQFLPGGNAYAVVQEAGVSIHSTGLEGLIASLPHSCRVGGLAFLSQHEAISGAEDGQLRLWDTRSPQKPALTLHAHHQRVRGIVPLPAAGGQEPRQDVRVAVASGSSDGTVRLWDLRALGSDSGPSGRSAGLASPLCEAQTHARITCLCAVQKSTVPSRDQPAQKQIPARSMRDQIQEVEEPPGASRLKQDVPSALHASHPADLQQSPSGRAQNGQAAASSHHGKRRRHQTSQQHVVSNRSLEGKDAEADAGVVQDGIVVFPTQGSGEQTKALSRKLKHRRKRHSAA